MRFSGSIYDNLRQPGVFEQIERDSSRDTRWMKSQVLARLRLDDLLSNDSADGGLIVASFSDFLDGRLFTLLKPQDLKGIKLHIVCPPDIAQSHNPVERTLRGWIQDEEGKGLPTFFMAAIGGAANTNMADLIERRRDLNVRSLDDALEVIEAAGMEREHARELHAHWYNCDWAIKHNLIELRGFPGQKASAVPELQKFLIANQGRMTEWGLTDFGESVFSSALRRLQASGGKRDEPVRFLLKEEAANEGDLDRKREVKCVKELFFHHMFEAIAVGNKSAPEHSASAGDDDNYALPVEYLKRLERYEEDPPRIRLDVKIVSGLGELDAEKYSRLKESSITADISKGIALFKQVGDLTALDDALGELANELSAGHHILSEGVDNFVRQYVWPAAGAAAGNALQFALDPQAVELGMATAAAVTTAGSVLTQTAKNTISKVSSSLLRKSLVKATIGGLTDADSEP